MTRSTARLLLQRLPALVAAFLPGWLLAASGPSFEAVYEVRVNGKVRLETRISLTEDGGVWRHESVSEGTRGLARMLGADSLELSTGRFVDGRFEPDMFLHRSKIAGRDSIWDAQFDWEGMQVVTRHEDGTTVLPLEGRTEDPMSVTLALRGMLAAGGTETEIGVLRESEISRHVYRSGEPEFVETPLGCLEAIPVERVRDPGSKRYSTGWYARSAAFIPVQIRHGKRGGKEFLMRITRLVLDGEEFTAPDRCPAGQRAP